MDLAWTPAEASRDAQRAARGVLAITVGLVALGLVMVHSTISALRADGGENLVGGLSRQMVWVGVAAVVGFAVARTPLETLRRLGRPLLVVAIALLALTLLVSRDVKHAQRWLHLGGFSFQPSEVLKIAVLLYMADRLARRERAQSFGGRAPLLPLLAPVGLGVVLVLVAPDLGTSLFIAAETVVLLGLAGVRPQRVVPFVLTALPLIVFYAYTRFGHVRKRIAFYAAGPESNPQVREALVAIGSGGLFGVGLGQGTQKLHYFAEAHTDFIFAVIGEELGFVGCAAVVMAFMGFVWYGRRIAWRARDWTPHDPYAFYLAAGATFIVAFQALINIAVVTATAPTKGISLPFISVGGSNLLMACVCVGLLVNVARRASSDVAPDDAGR